MCDQEDGFVTSRMVCGQQDGRSRIGVSPVE